MKGAVITLLLIALLGVLVTLYFYAGGYNIAASKPHTDLVHWFLNGVQTNSIKAQASGIEAPNLDDESKIETGFSHYHQMCVTCHGAPGIEASEIGKGLYPSPPDLAEEAEEFTEAELFWTLKHGIKMTGMPAYGSTHDDESLWGIVAFMKKLPEISETEYQQMVADAGLGSAISRHGDDGHSHGETIEDHDNEPIEADHARKEGSESGSHDHDSHEHDQ